MRQQKNRKGCLFWLGVLLLVISGLTIIYALGSKDNWAWFICIVLGVIGYILAIHRNRNTTRTRSSNKISSADEVQRETDIEQCLQNIQEGRISASKLICAASPVMLKPGEEQLIVIPDIILKEPRSVRYSYGGYGGPSIRLAKGISFRLGAFGARGQSKDEIQTVDQGILTITNKRLVFTGVNQSRETDIFRIVTIKPYIEGIGIASSSRSKIQYYVGIEEGRYSITVKHNAKNYEEPLTGLWIACIIEGLIKRGQ